MIERTKFGWIPKEAAVYDASCVLAGETAFAAARLNGAEVILARGEAEKELEGRALDTGGKACPLTHENRLVLNELLPYTAPVSLGREGASFGLGDRLGVCAAAQLRAVQESGLKPVLAQQSLRELQFMHRTYEDVIDSAAFGAFRAGYRAGFSADGDHLKTREQIHAALNSGCTMITLDCSAVLRDCPNGEEAHAAFAALPVDFIHKLEQIYLDSEVAQRVGIFIDRAELECLCAQYLGSVLLAEKVYQTEILPLNRAVDLEISLDETAQTTSHAAHWFVAEELTRRNIGFTSIAPRFVGEFHKAVDYIGDQMELEADLAAHAKIAAHFGHKLSIHSGSDKFSVYPLIAKTTAGHYHIKTSGTSWLAVVRVLAERDPALFRRMYALARVSCAAAKKAYVVHVEPEKLPPPESLTDTALAELMQSDDGKQLMHITYGFLFDKPDLASAIHAAIELHKDQVLESVYQNIRAHIRALGGNAGE